MVRQAARARGAGRWSVVLANVAAAVALVLTVLCHVRAPAPLELERSSARAPATSPSRSGFDDIDATTVAAWRLFGDSGTPSAAEVKEVAATAPDVLPDTALGLALKGVAAGARDGSGYAIIGTGQDDDRRYRVGDALPGAATLVAVLADAVVIDNAGRRERLLLPRAPDDWSAPSPGTVHARQVPDTPGPTP